MQHKTDLSKFNNSWYKPGASALVRLLWYFTNAVFFNSAFPIISVKRFLLKLYGANVNEGVVIKPYVNIKYPWKLTLGKNVWLGEKVWIDNLANVTIGDNACVSQGAMLLCGNHNYKKSTFDLIVKEIIIEEGVWIGAQSVVCPGVVCSSHSVLSVNSVAVTNLESYTIYQGNPAVAIRKREISE
ncbi:MAG: WcaF family extracellular polysaccharide biosynthesis acetyltransferase [Bacteroidota bacterium]